MYGAELELDEDGEIVDDDGSQKQILVGTSRGGHIRMQKQYEAGTSHV